MRCTTVKCRATNRHELCFQVVASHPTSMKAQTPPMMHFYPHAACAARSAWASACQRPSQWWSVAPVQCTACSGYGCETHGTIFHARAGLEGQILACSGYVGNSRLVHLIYPQATGTRPRAYMCNSCDTSTDLLSVTTLYGGSCPASRVVTLMSGYCAIKTSADWLPLNGEMEERTAPPGTVP